jgi:hypothetical protein
MKKIKWAYCNNEAVGKVFFDLIVRYLQRVLFFLYPIYSGCLSRDGFFRQPQQDCLRCAVSRRLGLRKTTVGLAPFVCFFSGTFGRHETLWVSL